MKTSGGREDGFPGSATAPRRASGEWIHRLREPLTKFVFGFLRDHHATEDLVQETLLRVVRNLHRYRGQAALKTWVFSIARNLCVDYLRAPSRSRLKLLETLDPPDQHRALLRQAVPDSLCADPCRQVELAENRARVGEALAGLSPEAKDLLILRICLGLSYREIARRRGVAPTGVGTRLFRARQGLSKRLRS